MGNEQVKDVKESEFTHIVRDAPAKKKQNGERITVRPVGDPPKLRPNFSAVGDPPKLRPNFSGMTNEFSVFF